MARDKYYGEAVQLSDPANEAIPIIPGVALVDAARSMYVGKGGDISMKGTDDDAFRLWRDVPSGAFLPFRVAEVQESGTTATNMLALY